MKKIKFEYRIAFVYLLIGGLWILFSDLVLSLFVTDVTIITKLQMYKGWFYVVVTAILFFIFLKNHLRQLRKREAELQNAKDKSEKSENRYRDLYSLMRLMSDTMDDMLWAKDLNSNYIFANKAMCVKLLCANDTNEPIGKSDLFFALRERNSHPNEPNWHTFGEICANTDKTVLENMEAMRFNESGYIKNKFIFLDVHKAPLYNDEGKLIGVVGSARDITFSKLAEEELINAKAQVEESEERLKYAVNATNYGIWDWDISTGKLFISEKWCEIIGYETGDTELNDAYQSWLNRIHPDDYNYVIESLNQHLKLNIPYDVEYRHLHKSGIYKWQNSKGVALRNTAGKAYRMTGGIIDITEKKNIQEELKKSQEELQNFTSYLLKVREKERTEVSLEIHDSVAQYLVALKMEIGLYIKSISTSTEFIETEDVKSKLNKLVAKVEKTIKSTRMIMDGLMPPQLGLLGFIESAEAHLKNYEEVHNIKCILKYTPDAKNIQEELAIMLFRVLQESLTNILKHAHANSVTVKVTKTDKSLIMEIADDGNGFDQNKLANKDSYGLISMKEQVKRLNGHFKITSKINKGTKVYVEIPCSIE